jgi:UDP:flavonoid glycosyltransferase YjiC (YdhE family)
MRAFPTIIGDSLPEANQALLLDVVNRVLQSRGAPTVEGLPGLFAAERRAIFAVPQLDPYHAVRNETLLSPCFEIRSPLTPPETPSIFFSLPSTFTHLTMIVRALERTGAAIHGHVPGPRSVGLTLLTQARSHVFTTWPIPSDALRDVSVVMAASADVAVVAYLAGRPQLILRGDIETSFIATELEKRGAAIALDVIDAKTLTDAARELLDNPGYRSSAQEEARRAHASAPPDGSAAMVARWCLELIDRAWQDATP